MALIYAHDLWCVYMPMIFSSLFSFFSGEVPHFMVKTISLINIMLFIYIRTNTVLEQGMVRGCNKSSYRIRSHEAS